MTDLETTFGPAYPEAKRWARQLEALEGRLAAGAAQEPARTELLALGREALLANPLLRRGPILFVVRRQYRPGAPH
jgi:hypothetical protein